MTSATKSNMLWSLQVYQHFPEYVAGRHLADGFEKGFCTVKTPDQLTKQHVYSTAVFVLPQTAAEVAPALQHACSVVFEKGVLRDFFTTPPGIQN
jgi:phosphohistidine swiveling domain-containing protein